MFSYPPGPSCEVSPSLGERAVTRRFCRVKHLPGRESDGLPSSRLGGVGLGARPALAAKSPDDEGAGLTIPERETIIRALDDAPPGLEELRAVLLREHVGRVRDGLV